MTTRCCFALLLCLGTGQALAATPIQLQHAADPTAHITISNVAGSVNVSAWDRDQVQVGGTLGDGAKPLMITGNNAELAIKVESQGGRAGSTSAARGGWPRRRWRYACHAPLH